MKQIPLENIDIQERFIKLYALGHEGPIAEAPFYRHALGFDGEPGKSGTNILL